MIGMIVAVDENNAIGNKGQLLCHLSLDLQHFKRTTWQQAVVMGRKTFAAIGRALPERENFVLTRDPTLSLEGCRCVPSLAEALAQTTCANVWILGGGEVYAAYLSRVEQVVLTKIHHCFPEADTFFPLLAEAEWVCVSTEWHARSSANRYPLSFMVYQRRST